MWCTLGYGMAGAMLLWWLIIIGGVFLAGYGLAQLIRNKSDRQKSSGSKGNSLQEE